MACLEKDERFRLLGMKSPDLCFLKKTESSAKQWGRERQYCPATLVDNWYEDRRAYMRICPRFTGLSITSTDYTPKCNDKNTIFPPIGYKYRLDDEGEGMKLLMNTEDYCDYLQNYTTTYDLMHNWEVRRAGCKPKPWRNWKLIMDASWTPERDNAISFGNLTQIGYRKAPQVPILPNDWDIYANNPTSYENDFPAPRYPQHYVHCRRAVSKALRKENEDLIMVKKPDQICFKCKDDHSQCLHDYSCPCVCHAIEHALGKNPKSKQPRIPQNPQRFSKYVPAGMLKQKPGIQNVHHPDQPSSCYRTLKRPPHVFQPECKPFCLAPNVTPESSPFYRPDICNDFAGDVRQE